jgi:hypothetical protein
MTILKRLVLAFLLSSAITSCPLWAQTSANPQPAAPTGRRFAQPCWKQAGVSSSAVPQLREIRQTMHTQVEAVCTDGSLTSQQKQQKVQQLRQEAFQQMDGLVGSQQVEALRSCYEQRAGGGGGMHHGNGSPCRSMAGNSGQKPNPQQP